MRFILFSIVVHCIISTVALVAFEINIYLFTIYLVPTSCFLSHAGRVLTWRPCISGRRSMDMERVAPPRRPSSFRRFLKTFLSQRQLRQQLELLCRDPEVLALSTTLILAN